MYNGNECVFTCTQLPNFVLRFSLSQKEGIKCVIKTILYYIIGTNYFYTQYLLKYIIMDTILITVKEFKFAIKFCVMRLKIKINYFCRWGLTPDQIFVNSVFVQFTLNLMYLLYPFYAWYSAFLIFFLVSFNCFCDHRFVFSPSMTFQYFFLNLVLNSCSIFRSWVQR